MTRSSEPYLIGIAGGTGSGKTHFVQRIVSEMGEDRCLVIEQDAYYHDLSHLPFSKREKVNFDHPSAVDFDLLASHLRALKKGREVLVPVYDFSTHTRKAATVSVLAKPLILIEGIFVLHHEALRSQLDLKIYLDADRETRLQRRVRRDLKERGRSKKSVLRQYEKTVLPMHRDYVEPSSQHADLILPYGGDATSAVELVVSELRGIKSKSGS